MRSLKIILPFVISLMLLSSIGGLADRESYYQVESRFGQWVSADSGHFPKSRNVYLWAKDQTSKEKITVIFGGSSVLHGVGQTINDSIAEKLNDFLGDQYSVVNLALRGGNVGGQGLVIAKSMSNEGYNVVYIADVKSTNFNFSFPDNSPYEYFYWDAINEGLIERNSAIEREYASKSTPKAVMAIESKLHFLSLINYISYNYFKLNHSLAMSDMRFSPLKSYTDTQSESVPTESRYPDDQKVLDSMRKLFSTKVEEVQVGRFAKFLRDIVENSNPIKSIFAVCDQSPYYINRLNSIQVGNFDSNKALLRSTGSDYGLNLVDMCNNLRSQDYIDSVHLSETGATTAAEVLARAIRSLEK
jgi:hypothetical protein